jgi:hypothetical protein
VWCHVCEALASAAGEARTAGDTAERSELFCERCGVALSGGEVAGPALRRLSQLARFGVAGFARRARRPRGSAPRGG